MVKVGILGIMGRMGQALSQAVSAEEALSLIIGSESPGHALVGKTTPDGSAPVTDQTDVVFDASDLVIDFTPPGNTARHAALAAEKQTMLLVGTTGLTDADEAALDAAAERVAIMQAGNYSLGINLLMSLVREAAARLEDGWDIDILEMHHRHKIDAPSGTALMLGEAAATGRGVPLASVRTPAREGITGEREEGSIGFAALRGGSVIGEHSVVIASESERLTLSHRAENRGLFADGAVRAAVWLSKQGPGRYSMRDVLGL